MGSFLVVLNILDLADFHSDLDPVVGATMTTTAEEEDGAVMEEGLGGRSTTQKVLIQKKTVDLLFRTSFRKDEMMVDMPIDGCSQ